MLLFIHLVGVAVLFGALSIEVFALVNLGRAGTVEDVRTATHLVRYIPILMPVATVLLVGSGVWMVLISDRSSFTTGWVAVSVVLTVLLAAAGPAVQGRRTSRVVALAAAADSRPGELLAATRDATMHVAGWISTAEAFALLYLMTVKPSLVGSLVAVVVAAVLGIAIAALARRPRVADATELVASSE
jgi:uncharacterized membrane protein